MGTTDTVLLRAECIRQELAPLAMNAYPEAYAEFQEIMLQFTRPLAANVAPVGDNWFDRGISLNLASAYTVDERIFSSKHDAGRLCRTLRQAFGMPVLQNSLAGCGTSDVPSCIDTCEFAQAFPYSCILFKW
jgi:hypothetical protein